MTRSVSRRTFLKTGALAAAATVRAGCEPGKRRWVNLEPYVKPPEEQLDGVPAYYASACRGCGAGCGIVVKVINGRAIKIDGNPEHPLNQGKLCAQGQAGLQLLYNPDRITQPMATAKRGGGDLQAIPWDNAIATLAQQIQNAGNAVAILAGTTTPGHVLDLLGRLAKAVGAPAPVIFDAGSAWNGEAAHDAASKQILGAADPVGYALGGTDVVFSFGGDFLGGGRSMVRYNIEYGRFRTQGLGLRGYLVQFEPHMSLTGAKADRWYAIQPGTEGLVALAIARIIADEKLGPSGWADRAATVAGGVDVNAASKAADVPADELRRLARVFAAAQHPLAIPGNGPSGSSAIAAAQALNAIAGAGGVAFTAALPVGGLARPAASSYGDFLKLLDSIRSGAVKTLLICGANPVHDLPAKAGFVDALDKVGYVATFSPLMDETAANSHLALGERTYLESWGYTVPAPNFGMPIVTSQQPVVPPLNDARSAADILIATAKQVRAIAGQFTWNDEVAFLRDTIDRLPAGAAGGDDADTRWARFLQHGGGWPAQPQAQPAASAPPAPAAITVAPPQYQGDAAQYPFFLYVFRPVLPGMGYGANLPWLQGSPEPLTSMSWQTWVAINPATAGQLGVQKEDVVRVTTPNGSLEAPVDVTPGVRPGVVAGPLGQGHTNLGRYAQNRGANAMTLLGAQANQGNNTPAWAAVRCQVKAPGATVRMATMEWTPGTTQGFMNKGLPGQ